MRTIIPNWIKVIANARTKQEEPVFDCNKREKQSLTQFENWSLLLKTEQIQSTRSRASTDEKKREEREGDREQCHCVSVFNRARNGMEMKFISSAENEHIIAIMCEVI